MSELKELTKIRCGVCGHFQQVHGDFGCRASECDCDMTPAELIEIQLAAQKETILQLGSIVEEQLAHLKTANESLKIAYLFVKGTDLRRDIQAVIDRIDGAK